MGEQLLLQGSHGLCKHAGQLGGVKRLLGGRRGQLQGLLASRMSLQGVHRVTMGNERLGAHNLLAGGLLRRGATLARVSLRVHRHCLGRRDRDTAGDHGVAGSRGRSAGILGHLIELVNEHR